MLTKTQRYLKCPETAGEPCSYLLISSLDLHSYITKVVGNKLKQWINEIDQSSQKYNLNSLEKSRGWI